MTNEKKANMTNEKKAIELSSMNKYDFTVEESNAAYNAAIEAMKWKEQQMIDKAWDWILIYFVYGTPLEFQKEMEKGFRNAMED